MKFTNEVTENRYDFESIESFLEKYISVFSIIQNVNLHLDLHILRNVRNDRVVSIDLRKKKRKMIMAL